MNIKLSYEDVTNFPEAKETYFGFNSINGVIRDNETIVGFYDILDCEDEIDIKELEILIRHQLKGYGTAFIQKIFEEYPLCEQITGNSLEESVHFYANLGAHVIDPCEECSADNCSLSGSFIETDNFENEDYFDSSSCEMKEDNLFTLKREDFFINLKYQRKTS